jgi:glycosyltransferase involved in cell wall biosynthesis
VARLSMPFVQRVFKWIDRQKRGATILVAGGARTREALGYAGVVPEKMIDTLDSGVAPSLFEYRPIVQDGRSSRFVFVGRLVAYKGCDLAIEALALAPPDLTLDVIGEGPERISLEALAAARGVKDRVRFLGWQTPDDAYYRTLQTYRALILPTLAEANGIVFQEAMTIGLPIVAVDWGGAAQLLDGGTAVLVEPASREASIASLCKAITQLAGDCQKANELAQAARHRAEVQGFSWPRLLAAWEAVYASVSGGNAR